MNFKKILDYVEENKEQQLAEILEQNKIDCKECNGEGYFSNADGTDFTPCEQCLGEGTIA